ncbi:MAG: DinB family protein [Planctomycetota bacterium]|nr:DinB family protein [Planctomycetota bacterium]MEE3284307.1 DinB family protein [Planctomycetota bacterium]MEE3364884.1 DinB family protein [Planctomycetota bacterium]
MSRISEVIDRIQSVRDYTAGLVDAVPESDWFRQPAEGVTHVAWQVGHMAMAQYRLALDLVRGVQPGDDELIGARVLDTYGKDSIPDPDPSANAGVEEIRSAYDAVHLAVIREIGGMDDSILDEPSSRPHPVFDTKGGALEWSAWHEMLHAGQIGLIRRLLGEKWLR